MGARPLTTTADETEAELLARAGRGDVSAMRRLAVLWAPRLHGFFARAFLNDALAGQLMRATLRALHERRRSYRAGEPVKPWLFAVAADVRRAELRRQRCLPATAGEAELARSEPSAPSPPDHSPHVGPACRIDAARVAIGRLPELQRMVVHLHGCEGMTFGEIGGVLEMTASAAWYLAVNAYEQLREELRVFLSPDPSVN
jgi:RNA polymerase sigma-70 factor (ECF subfamily)